MWRTQIAQDPDFQMFYNALPVTIQMDLENALNISLNISSDFGKYCLLQEVTINLFNYFLFIFADYKSFVFASSFQQSNTCVAKSLAFLAFVWQNEYFC